MALLEPFSKGSRELVSVLCLPFCLVVCLFVFLVVCLFSGWTCTMNLRTVLTAPSWKDIYISGPLKQPSCSSHPTDTNTHILSYHLSDLPEIWTRAWGGRRWLGDRDWEWCSYHKVGKEVEVVRSKWRLIPYLESCLRSKRWNLLGPAIIAKGAWIQPRSGFADKNLVKGEPVFLLDNYMQ